MAARIIHLSDLHVGKKEVLDKTDENANLKKIVNKIVTRFEGDADKPVVLITGDVVDDGEEDQFNDARKILDPLYKNGFIVLPVPGNHDYGWNGNHAQAKRFNYFKSAFFGRENPHYPCDTVSYPYTKFLQGHWLIGLNSMKAECGFVDGLLADGELGPDQIRDLVGILKKLQPTRDQQKIILYLHHHPFIFPDDIAKPATYLGEKVAHQLKDGDEFMNAIAGKVDVLLFGHDHFHIDFSKTQIARRYNIPHIYSSGKSTEEGKELVPHKDGTTGDPDDLKEEEERKKYQKGLLGRLITLTDDGNIEAETISF